MVSETDNASSDGEDGAGAPAASEEEFAFGFTSDFTELRRHVQEFLADAARLERMSPWDHLAWAQDLPRLSEEIRKKYRHFLILTYETRNTEVSGRVRGQN